MPQTFRPNHVAKEYIRANSDHVYDVDADGWLDVIAGGWQEDGIYWYKNPGNGPAERGAPWEMHKPWEARLLTKTRGTMEMFALHDFNGDGQPELYSANYRKKEPLEIWRFNKGARRACRCCCPSCWGPRAAGTASRSATSTATAARTC